MAKVGLGECLGSLFVEIFITLHLVENVVGVVLISIKRRRGVREHVLFLVGDQSSLS